jgi:hypothetical protein
VPFIRGKDRRTIQEAPLDIGGPVKFASSTRDLEGRYRRETRRLQQQLAVLSDKLTSADINENIIVEGAVTEFRFVDEILKALEPKQ